MPPDELQNKNGQSKVRVVTPVMVDLPPPYKLLPKMALDTAMRSFVGSTIATLSALTVLTAWAMFLCYLITGLFVYYGAYQTKSADKKEEYWIKMSWNHIILIGACMAGSFWSAGLYAVGCNLMMILDPPLRTLIPAGCRLSISLDIIVVSMLGLVTMPVLLSLLSWRQTGA